MCFSYFESFLNWVTVFIEAVDIETSLTVFSDWRKNFLIYVFSSTFNLYFLFNFLIDEINSITGFSVGEEPEVTIVRLFYVDGSLIRGRNKTRTIGVS